MQRILGLSTLGLLLLAGTSDAQQPSASSGASSVPVVQSGTQGGYGPAASSSRRFGRIRGGNTYDGGSRFGNRRSYSGNSNVVSPAPATAASQPVVQASATMPNAESKAVTKTETSRSKTQTVAPDANPPVQQSSATPTRRMGSRGGLLSRLGSRMGR